MVNEFNLQRQLIKLGNQLSNRRQKDLARHDLTVNQSATLLYFADNPGNLIQDLKDYLCVSHQAAQKVVMKLRERQLLKTQISTNDNRTHPLYLTQTGERLVEQLQNNGQLAGQQVLAPLTELQKKQLTEIITLLLADK